MQSVVSSNIIIIIIIIITNHGTSFRSLAVGKLRCKYVAFRQPLVNMERIFFYNMNYCQTLPSLMTSYVSVSDIHHEYPPFQEGLPHRESSRSVRRSVRHITKFCHEYSRKRRECYCDGKWVLHNSVHQELYPDTFGLLGCKFENFRETNYF